jgi:hypothetical protein
MIVASMGGSLWFGRFPAALKIVAAVVGAGVILLIWSYPSEPSPRRIPRV